MSAIEIGALEALAEAIDSACASISHGELAIILREMDRLGWQLTRKPEPVIEAAPTSIIQPLWPPLGITQKLWAEINPDGLELIEDEIGLRAAAAIGSTIFEARTLAQAERYWRNPTLVRTDSLEYGGTKFAYMTDQIPF